MFAIFNLLIFIAGLLLLFNVDNTFMGAIYFCYAVVLIVPSLLVMLGMIVKRLYK